MGFLMDRGLCPSASGLYYQGREEDGVHRFAVVKRPFMDGTGKRVMQIKDWDPRACTAVEPEVSCGKHSFAGRVQGCDVYVCHGHDLLGHEAAAARGPGHASGAVDVTPRASPVGGAGSSTDPVPVDLGTPSPAPHPVAGVGDLDELGVHRLPGEGAGVSAADTGGVLPVERNLDGDDYCVVHPARGAVARVYVQWRKDKWEPDDLTK